MTSGVVIFDGNCFRYLEDPSIRDRVRASLKAADFELWPTSLNAMEVAKTRNDARRERLLHILSDLCPGRVLLPDPLRILRRVAYTELNGEMGFQTDTSGLEWLLEDASLLTPEIIDRAQSLFQETNASFEETHKEMRAILKRYKPSQIQETWPTAAAFLDSQWMRAEQLDTLIQGIWESLELLGKAPIELVLSMKAWRLYLEGLGAVIYRRAVSRELGREVEPSDISQLVYLAGRRRSLLVTKDIGFRQAAQDVIHGRHSDLRVLSWEDFLKGV